MGTILKVHRNQTVLHLSVSMSGGSTVVSTSDSEVIGLCQNLSSTLIITTKVISRNMLMVHTLTRSIEPTREIYIQIHYSIGTSIQTNGPPVDECLFLLLSTNIFVVFPACSKNINNYLFNCTDSIPSRIN
jgi:hypothetical protein